MGWYLHIDMDAFFASVEQVLDPSLKGKPVIVGGRSGRGVVTSASYEARKFGVHSAMPGFQAKKLCPHGIFLPNRHRVYSEFSDRVFAILERYSPEVHALSIDEALSRSHGNRKAPRSAAQNRRPDHQTYRNRSWIALLGRCCHESNHRQDRRHTGKAARSHLCAGRLRERFPRTVGRRNDSRGWPKNS